MVVAGTVLHDHSRTHAALRIQLPQRLRWEVFDHPTCSPNLASIDYHLSQHLKWFLSKQHFHSDERRLSQSGSESVYINGSHSIVTKVVLWMYGGTFQHAG
ncbi:hypothetical protein AVEN_123873-1 [Araneus ventricosus]|uniref:Uncharacterized protein n=1 Tax=Araneus ventricosus TaxID=182803 RepID=A0A4Y2GCE5_ARAVE|nr:hypothetical protein AVEN_123873-1 [Araneus ventricosus]